MQLKNVGNFENLFVIREAVTYNFSCNLILLSCWKCSEYIALSLAEFSKNLTERNN